MDSLINDLEQLKLSALQKLQVINSSNVLNADNSKISNNKISSPKKVEKIINVTKSNSGNEIENVLNKLELQRRQEVKNNVQARIHKIEGFTKQQELNRQQQWQKIQQSFVENIQQEENNIFQAMHEFDKNLSNTQAKLAQYYQNLHLRRQMQEQELRRREKETQIAHERIDRIKKYQQEFNIMYRVILTTLTKCFEIEELKVKLWDNSKVLKVLPENFEKIIAKCKSGKVSEEDEKLAAQTLAHLRDLENRIKDAIEQATKKCEIDNSVKEVEPVTEPEPAPVVATPAPVVSTPAPIERNQPQQQQTSDVASFARYVSIPNLKMYTDTLDFFEKHTESFKQLHEDASLKQFKFDCKKAVNIPVNSLSGLNSDHISDKYNRLRCLLNGQDVVVSDKRINAAKHPQGIAFCKDLLAKKFVLQGDLMVSSNPESAFCYATVMASLWNDFPDFGQLLLAHFYKSCPYLVPCCIPRQVGESDEEFYARQGYQYIDGQIEKQDKFLKRMTGIMRLYAAIMVVKPKRGQKSTPYNIRHGWRWLSSLLKVDPQVDITATVLHTFLETVGFEMEQRYGRAFQKLVKIIVNKFLPDCREKCTGGAITRLELLLTNYFKNRRFEKPNGYSDYSNW